MGTPRLTRRAWARTAAAAPLAWWIPAGAPAAEPIPRGVLLTGTTAEPSAAIPLRAGPVTALFEPGIAFLRYIKLGDREILRGLYAAVRDQVWGTVAPRVRNVVTESRVDSFRLTFDVDNVEGGIDFGWQGIITGDAAGTVRFEFNGVARSTFLKNRLGFAVLHPIRECAGKPCTIEKSGGLKEAATFPDAISPHQPMLDLRAVTHEVAAGIEAEVRFEGEVFEMEDHRNWTDGNYKTYCTPLAQPYPVEVKRGQVVRQAVTIKLKGAAAARGRSSAPDIVELAIAPAGAPVKLPALGFGIAAGQSTLSATEAARLRVLRPAHLRVDLRLSDPAWTQAWTRALGEAALVGASVEAAIFLSDQGETELQAVAARAATGRARIARWLVFHQDAKVAPEKWAVAARRILGGGAPIVIGTNEYFTELNRERPAPASVLDASCYSINPQVHAFDNRSLVENLEPQGETVRSAQRFLGTGKGVSVTPVTLKPRFNPQAKGAPEPAVEGRLPSRIDVRQMSLFGAVWTLGSIKYLAEAGAASVTYFETHGWAGLMEAAGGPPLPALFPSPAGAVFPLYHVFADVGEFAGGMVHPVVSARPLEACALALEKAGRRRMLVANLTGEPRIVAVSAAAKWLGPRVRITLLDEQNAEPAMRTPERFRAMASGGEGGDRLAMLPYSIARLDPARM